MLNSFINKGTGNSHTELPSEQEQHKDECWAEWRTLRVVPKNGYTTVYSSNNGMKNKLKKRKQRKSQLKLDEHWAALQLLGWKMQYAQR